MVSGVIKSQVFLPRWFPGWLLAWSRVLSRFDDQVYLVGFSVAFPFPLLFRVHGWVFPSFPSPCLRSRFLRYHLWLGFLILSLPQL
jgi:hypothetical protein